MARIDALKNELANVTDPRIDKNKKHPLVEIMIISVCAIIAGAEGPTDIKDWAKANVEWLKKFLELPGGVPSKDTFLRVLSRIDPQEFQNVFLQWIKSTFAKSAKMDDTTKRTIGLDGKTLRRSGQPLCDILPVHIVSAWCNELEISLGQLNVDKKSNEITAIPKLLDSIDIEGDIVTIDAMGCQTAIAEKIVDQKGDYILQVKGNQKTLHGELVQAFDEAVGERSVNADVRQYVTYDEGHGREETRYHFLMQITPEMTSAFGWPHAIAVGMVIRETVHGDGHRSEEKSYYITSRFFSGRQFAKSVRAHWGVESQHWLLDVVFNEDQHRTRDVPLASNLSMLRRFAIGLLKKAPDKRSIKRRRKMCGWQTSYLENILGIQD